MTIPDDKRINCHNAALKCYGTAYIFEQKAKKIRQKINVLSFLGIAVPASLGAIVVTLGLDSDYIPIAIIIASIFALIQLFLTIWSLVAQWNDNLSYYIESKSANYQLADEYHKLATSQSIAENDFEVEYRVLETQSKSRADLDNRVDISEKEKRMGMRAGLRRYQRKCAGCREVPISMKPTKCGVCGNF